MSESLKCPECNQIDKVSKVATVVESGTHRVSGQVPVSHTTQDSDGRLHTETTYESYSAVQQTDLAKRLNPPTEPQLPPHMIGGIFGIIQKGFLYIYGGGIFLMGLGISAIPLIVAITPDPQMTSIINRVLLFLLGIITVPLYLGLAIFLYKKKVASALCVYNSDTNPPNNLVSRAQEKRHENRGRARSGRRSYEDRGGRQSKAAAACGRI